MYHLRDLIENKYHFNYLNENDYNLETLYQFVIEKLFEVALSCYNDAEWKFEEETHETVDGNPSSKIGA